MDPFQVLIFLSILLRVVKNSWLYCLPYPQHQTTMSYKDMHTCINASSNFVHMLNLPCHPKEEYSG